MLKTRILTAIAGIPLILLILYKGGYFWTGFFLILGILALYEFYRMMKKPELTILFAVGYAFMLLIILAPLYLDLDALLQGFLLILVTVIIITVLCYPKFTINDIAMVFFAPSYLGVLLSYTIKTASLPHSFSIAVLALLLTWSSDIGGYCAGSLLGKHKLAPLLSPKKTWEGAVGSVVLSVLTALLFFRFVEWGHLNPAYVLILGISASLAAQFGDLFISGIKRFFGVKDSGNIIPGHGGVLDRFDSFFMVAPLVYLFIRIIG